jgi:tRNA pseudouridine32 synthase/23S rRNA pseudouridine746 synthase
MSSPPLHRSLATMTLDLDRPDSDDTALPVVHADEHLVVVNKPSGLLSVPGRGPDKQDCVWRRVQAHFADALVVHRLDQATSGLLVLARGIEAQRRLSAAFAQRQVRKRYLAWVHGHPRPTLERSDEPGWSAIDLPLMADWPNRPRQIVSPEGKPCLTFWRLIEHRDAPDRSLLELRPHTGRSHQLRVHLQAMGHPILGDDLYGHPHAPASPALQLHARSLTLPHPFEDRTLDLQAPWPSHWGLIESEPTDRSV